MYACAYLRMHMQTRGMHMHTHVYARILVPKNVDLGFYNFDCFA